MRLSLYPNYGNPTLVPYKNLPVLLMPGLMLVFVLLKFHETVVSIS